MVQVSLRSRIMRQKALALIDELWSLYPDLDLAFSYLPEGEVLCCRNHTFPERSASCDRDADVNGAAAREVTVRVGKINNFELLKQLEQSLGLRHKLDNSRLQMSD